MLKWYIFRAEKDGAVEEGKIPAESWTSAREELERLGYTDAVCEDFYRF